MFDHVGIRVSDYQAARAFYEKVLAVFGYKVVYEMPSMPTFCGFGADKPMFWISQAHEAGHASQGVHVGFAAKDQAEVQAFYAAGLAVGGKDNGQPGPRPDYGPTYYGGFVLDLDGNNVEAVCHVPQA
ncbi:VOC family protein [Candidatus Uhrbacteria bacterium]|nr:VOC family protein [Candidatus Uhrbacteria bacterium]